MEFQAFKLNNGSIIDMLVIDQRTMDFDALSIRISKVIDRDATAGPKFRHIYEEIDRKRHEVVYTRYADRDSIRRCYPWAVAELDKAATEPCEAKLIDDVVAVEPPPTTLQTMENALLKQLEALESLQKEWKGDLEPTIQISKAMNETTCALVTCLRTYCDDPMRSSRWPPVAGRQTI